MVSGSKPYEIVCSRETLNAAFEVTLRRGSRPGADGIKCRNLLPHQQEYVSDLSTLLKKQAYVPGRSRIIKKNYKGKTINVHILCVRDLIVQRAVRMALSGLYTNDSPLFGSPVCLCRSLQECRRRTCLVAAMNWIARLDVKNFYSSIDLNRLFDELLRYTGDEGIVDLVSTCLAGEDRCGLPIGHPLSTFLANIYLAPVDFAIGPEATGLAFRYSDEWNITWERQEVLTEWANRLTQSCAIRGLQTHPLEMGQHFPNGG